MSAQHPFPDDFQHHVMACGQRLLDAYHEVENNQSSAHRWLDLLINRTISDTQFRIQALRFVDVLPTLDDDHVLAEHLQEYFADLELPRFAEWGLRHSDTPWATRIAAPTVRYTLRGLARKFMGGSQLHHALTTISRLRHRKLNFTLDLLGEATISELECEQYQQAYLSMIESLSAPVENWTFNSLLDQRYGAIAPRLNLSLKLSSLYSQITPAAPEQCIESICQRLRPILRSAMSCNACITIDMEQYDLKHIVLGCFQQILLEDEFREWPHIGIAIQAYLKESYADIEQLISLARERGIPFGIRLVRGAYWDYETVIARQNNWDCPVWENKSDTDYNYEQCLQLLLNAHPHINTAIATHNPRSIAFALALIEQLSLGRDQYEFQMLYGMADALKQALTSLEQPLRVYVPYGETLPGMAYLVRRLLENASGQSLLDSGFGHQAIAFDSSTFNPPQPAEAQLQLRRIDAETFTNTPLLRFTDKQQRLEFSRALQNELAQVGQHYPLIINGKEIYTSTHIASYNPAHPDQLIGEVSSASHAQADLALASANQAFPGWSSMAVQQRADFLRRVAGQLARERMQFAALEVLEAGKSWQEADADVCEAIDFLMYYSLQAEQLFSDQYNNVSGEDNEFLYQPRGVSLVIPPWNFPLAILCGMLSASIVTGNTAILKPSSLTPVIAARFMKLWQEVDLPEGVINFLPGSGKIVGEYLSRKPDIHIIAFTGSLEVGSQLISTGAQIQPGQHHIKKVITEMGGKNAIIIDADADLDDAILGTLRSAFGFQGQKCSAASRVIVVGHIYERFIERLTEATRSLAIGDPQNPEYFMGPVIDNASLDRIQQTISHARHSARLHQEELNLDTHDGFYNAPAIFTDVDPSSPLAQEEIFGPVLAVIRAETFEQAIDIANATRYSLTGGVYSRQPSHLQYARRHFNVGNLYLNRKITGALVSRQPFGGFNMSGSGHKAGGKDYLLQFVHARCITENTLRRGFAPEPEDQAHND